MTRLRSFAASAGKPNHPAACHGQPTNGAAVVADRQTLAVVALAVVFLLLHIPFLPTSLEDLDSVNFALGLRDFDVAEHQPHPPGYPVFMIAARAMFVLTGSEVAALSQTSLMAGALAIFALAALFGALDRERRPAVLTATALVTVTPLYWLTAARPLSDMAGLAAALATQALLLMARTPTTLVWAAAAAGFAVGVRSQVAWLTLPLLVFVVLTLPTTSRARLAGATAAAYLAGVLAWGVPLVLTTGGPLGYWRALTTQGAEDFAGVSMLLTSFTPRLALSALSDTFVAPWAGGWLAAPVLVAAGAGTLGALRRDRSRLALLMLAFGPYLAFHLLLQETFTTRYALPIVVPIAWLAVRGLETLGKTGLAFAGGLVIAIFSVSQPAVMAYGRSAPPAFQLLADMRAARTAGEEAPVLAMHRRGAFDFRRPLRWQRDVLPPFAGQLESPPKHEWLELVRYWNSGGRSPVWFIADPFRSDLALIHHKGPAASYRWSFPSALVGGARPDIIDWYVFDRPAWYLGEGWALTPEAAGVAGEDGRGPGIAPIEGWIRRTDSPLRLMVGGRNLEDGGAPLDVTVRLDGIVLSRWSQAPGFFLRWIDTANLPGPGDYARLTIEGTRPALAIEQFDAQPAGEAMYGYGDGWHELEFDPERGQLWRWSSDRAIVDVRAGARPLELRLHGETDPSVDQPRIVVRADDRILLEERADGEFSFAVTVEGVAPDGAAKLSIETDQVHVPAERRRDSTDRRRLGLKVYEVALRPVS